MPEPAQATKKVWWLALGCVCISLLVAISYHSRTPHASCADATIMGVVAHQDDDLLFMNPDILSALRAGYCVRTVYLTAGDNGQGRAYWHAREQGAEAAYASMIHSRSPWIERTVTLANNESINVASPNNNNAVTLIFLRLPDGNMKGQGFAATGHASLSKLLTHQIPVIHSVDNQSTYNLDQLETALQTLMSQYAPTRVFTQAPSPTLPSQDHSDHNATGTVTSVAYAHYAPAKKNITFYVGYPSEHYPANISPDEAAAKAIIFLTYAHYDRQACPATLLCTNTPYQSYFLRQYTTANSFRR